MKKINTNNANGHFTARAALLALGVKMEQIGIFQPMMEKVHINQKGVKDTPGEKMLDGLITILAGAQGLVEANKRVRTDPALQRAFGRKRCAEQSVISETLDAATEENVHQIQQAMQEIYQRHSQGYRHDYDQEWQLLDIDLSGQPCGKKAEFATKAYFAKQRNRRGRQLGRVLASWYQEIVVDRLYEGQTILPVVLQDLVKQPRMCSPWMKPKSSVLFCGLMGMVVLEQTSTGCWRKAIRFIPKNIRVNGRPNWRKVSRLA